MYQLSKLVCLLFVFSFNKIYWATTISWALCKVQGQCSLMCHYFFFLVPISSASNFAPSVFCGMLSKLTLEQSYEGPTTVEGCAWQNLILWIVPWCTHAVHGSSMGYEMCLFRKERAPPALCCFPRFGLLFSGVAPQALCKQRKNEICQLSDPCGSTGALAMLSNGVGMKQGSQNLSWEEIGHDLLPPRGRCAWPEVV